MTGIELFSGHKIVSSVFEKHGYNMISIDNNPKLNPAICCDILELDYKTLPGSVDFIWASPPCTTFSRAAPIYHWLKSEVKYRQYNYTPLTEFAGKSLAILKATVNLINFYYPVPFIIENPVGRIHHFTDMKKLGHYRFFVNYASFGHPFSKETYLFTNIQFPFSTKKYKVNAPGLRSIRNVAKRSEIPKGLAEFIVNYLQQPRQTKDIKSSKLMVQSK